MSDQLFTYYIENPWMIISINSGSWGGGEVMAIRLDVETWVIGKGGTKKKVWEKGGWVGEEIWGLLSFVALVCVWVYFCCCSGGCFCQGFQGAWGMYSWHR
jgi:hypothetical protein